MLHMQCRQLWLSCQASSAHAGRAPGCQPAPALSPASPLRSPRQPPCTASLAVPGPAGAAQHGAAARRRRLSARAAGGDPQQQGEAMSANQARTLLGVQPSAGFEEVLRAKNRALARVQPDSEDALQIEVAYDVLLMASMKRRLSGELEDQRIKFADVRKPRAMQKAAGAGEGGISSLVRVEQPPTNIALRQSAIFGGLAIWTLLQGLAEPAGLADGGDLPGLQLALGAGAALYHLRSTKRLGFGRSAGLSVAGLVAGALLGQALQSYLRVDIVPLGGLSSPGSLVGELALLGLWATSTFLY